jgi:hypothetical protein
VAQEESSRAEESLHTLPLGSSYFDIGSMLLAESDFYERNELEMPDRSLFDFKRPWAAHEQAERW